MKNSEKLHDGTKSDNTDNNEMDKAVSHIIVEIIEYVPNSVVIKTIIKKSSKTNSKS